MSNIIISNDSSNPGYLPPDNNNDTNNLNIVDENPKENGDVLNSYESESKKSIVPSDNSIQQEFQANSSINNNSSKGNLSNNENEKMDLGISDIKKKSEIESSQSKLGLTEFLPNEQNIKNDIPPDMDKEKIIQEISFFLKKGYIPLFIKPLGHKVMYAYAHKKKTIRSIIKFYNKKYNVICDTSIPFYYKGEKVDIDTNIEDLHIEPVGCISNEK